MFYLGWHDCDEIETSYNGYDEFSKILADLYAFQKEYLDKSSEGGIISRILMFVFIA